MLGYALQYILIFMFERVVLRPQPKCGLEVLDIGRCYHIIMDIYRSVVEGLVWAKFVFSYYHGYIV